MSDSSRKRIIRRKAASGARALANTFSGGARNDETHAPLMGEQTREILAEAGYAQAEIETLLAAGAAS
jgi:crotonobetainyl-CoA:carnitine CoA-transferase CaiB-like acyl-CoA transferase